MKKLSLLLFVLLSYCQSKRSHKKDEMDINTIIMRENGKLRSTAKNDFKILGACLDEIFDIKKNSIINF